MWGRKDRQTERERERGRGGQLSGGLPETSGARTLMLELIAAV